MLKLMKWNEKEIKQKLYVIFLIIFHLLHILILLDKYNYKRRSNVNRRPNISFYGVSETSKDLIAAMNKKEWGILSWMW